MKSQSQYTRIQTQKRADIFKAALVTFSQYGFRGSSLDQIAKQANLSKPNLLYYFESKEEVFVELIKQLMDLWLEPLEKMDPEGEPIEEILNYIQRKLEISRLHPRESRLFANEILQGAPNTTDLITGPLKVLVDERAKVLEKWAKEGRIANFDPYDLIFSIWATTQHYADFSAQISLISPRSSKDKYVSASKFLRSFYSAALQNKSSS